MAVIWQERDTRLLGMLCCFSLSPPPLLSCSPWESRQLSQGGGQGLRLFFLKKGYCYCTAAASGMPAILWLVLTQDGMQMNAFRKQACLECWVAILSSWSSATLASLVNNEKLDWLEPNRIPGSCYPMLPVRRIVCILMFVSRMFEPSRTVCW